MTRPDPCAEHVRVAVVDAERWDDCRDLWLALRDHSADTEPQLGPRRSDDESWAMASGQWGAKLAAPGAFLVVAESRSDVHGVPLGCALVTVADGSPSWPTPDRLGYVEVLSVAPEARGRGIGTRLMQVVVTELERNGIGEVRLLVTANNIRAQAFYRAAGFEPFGMVLRRPGVAPRSGPSRTNGW